MSSNWLKEKNALKLNSCDQDVYILGATFNRFLLAIPHDVSGSFTVGFYDACHSVAAYFKSINSCVNLPFWGVTEVTGLMVANKSNGESVGGENVES